MEPDSYIDPHLTQADLLVLRQLLSDVENPQINLNNKIASHASDSGYNSLESANNSSSESESTSPVRLRNKNENSANPPTDTETIDNLHGATNPKDVRFEPTVFLTYDLATISLPFWIDNYLLQPYIKWARKIARVETDVVMVTHLILYFTTSVPSAIFLFYHFSYLHAILHCVMQAWYTGSYTLMRHQHIHMKGVLAHRYAWIDGLFPYITDPLTGHTWNSYYYHHVKHHHVEGNGPDDLSSTIRYQRDDIWHFAHYVGRFLLFTCLELPLYFLTKGRLSYAARIFISEFGTYTMFYLMARYVNTRATTFVFLVPFTLLRLALMVGNWGQHAFVDEVEPDSDYRSSITLIDVPSNRYSFNDGYHTSHHLNPLRHWREHPVSFLEQKARYAEEHALVFRNIDYIMLVVRLMRKDYNYLARCLIPIGPQIGMSHAEIADLLRTKTRMFSEEDIKRKFRKEVKHA